MDIVIRKLIPELAEEYVHFFDTTPHNNNTDDKCYCITWRSDDSYINDQPWFPSREERREHALQYVRKGHLQGYLAYCDDKIVGWCNANANCRNCIDYLRSYWPIEEYHPNVKIKSIFCFVIAPEMQRKGIATQLVEHICKDAANEGFDFVEAYTNEKFSDTANDFRGPLAMYEKCGFIKYAEQNGKIVVRKKLK